MWDRAEAMHQYKDSALIISTLIPILITNHFGLKICTMFRECNAGNNEPLITFASLSQVLQLFSF